MGRNLLTGKALQTLNFCYNIRSWLTHLNDAQLSTAGTDGDLFGLELRYNTGPDPQFNGNIAGQAWRSRIDNVSRGFDYGYDGLNRLKWAHYGSALAEENYNLTGYDNNWRETGIQYDRNGNVNHLYQWGLLSMEGNGRRFGVIDNLHYAYDGNRVRSVSDHTDQAAPNAAGDFFDANRESSGVDDYNYDYNGSLIQDRNKGIDFIVYNHLNLTSFVSFNGTSSYIQNRYDAAGTKLRQVVKEGTGAERTTDYVGGIVYQDNQLQFVPTSEGRLLPPSLVDNEGGWAYEYHYKDHLGNLRLAFRGGATTVLRATMEGSPAVKAREERQFTHLTDAIRDPNSCEGGGVKLTPQHPLGPMRLIKVRKGDVITAKVKGWYEAPAKNNAGRSLGLLLQAFPKDNLPGETGKSLPTLSVGLTLNSPGKSVPTEAPKAYLQLQAYDEKGGAAGQQTRFVASQDCLGELVIESYRVEADGYVRVYLANESDAPAWFDALSITYQEAMITQENHYGGFGLPLVGINKLGRPDYKFTFGGHEQVEALGLDWVDLGARTFDRQAPHFHQLDPLADQYPDWSPYSYAFNNPLRFIDPDGMAPQECPTCPRSGCQASRAGPSPEQLRDG